ncbi:acetoacetate--CoA ligase [Microbacterium schleiferi]|uniref:acetoacetate--CoA ligase n=1 Tax=Microbacterium schleiferi TaxID=69362 RepID=UPI00311FABD2
MTDSGQRAPAHEVLYRPSTAARDGSVIAEYLRWLAAERGLRFDDVQSLHAWSVDELEAFWQSVWDFFGVRASAPARSVLSGGPMPDVSWFEGAELNYAEHCLRHDVDALAIFATSQTREDVSLSFGDLAEQVRRVRAGLHRLGVGPGDRVVAYLPNIPETVVAFLATASLGAIWASCAPEFGARAVLDRFGQLDPDILLVVGGYRFGDKPIDKSADVAAIRAGLPTVRKTIGVPYGDFAVDADMAWDEIAAPADDPLTFAPVPFAHPLFVLFSSGTTGAPKPIVHGHGGILLEHLKTLGLHWDLRAGDRLMWFSTTAWMMWNTLVSTLLHGAAAVLIDGNPLYPDLDAQWRLAAQTRATLVGASPGLISASRAAGLSPAHDHDLSSVRQIGVAGSPLAAEGFVWIHEQFGDDVVLNVGSGGTDVCSAIVQGSPLHDVWLGEISGASLGVDAVAFDAAGEVIVDDLGELVIRRPMPSMPVGFWGDADGSRYRDTYFDVYPGVWRHGDWVRFAPGGSCVIAGRSDATLNRGGVRLGTAEFYRVVEELPDVTDSLVVHLEDPDGGPGVLVLFVVPATDAGAPAASAAWDEEQSVARITVALRSALTPRHVPDHIAVVSAIPHTKTGKKLEVPVKRVMQGSDPVELAALSSLDDPHALEPFARFARERGLLV